jgi:RNA polymerase sigma factor (sigma-70 family)
LQGFKLSNRILDEGKRKMQNRSSDDNNYIIESLEKYSDMVRKICFMYLHNFADVEDVFQDVFLKLLQNKPPFDNDEHEKAWLCRVTINRCKDLCKSFFRRNVSSINDVELPFEDKIENEVMQAVLSLPSKYKDVIYLFYYEDYTVPEIAKILNQKENTLYSNLHRARELLKKQLGGLYSE